MILALLLPFALFVKPRLSENPTGNRMVERGSHARLEVTSVSWRLVENGRAPRVFVFGIVRNPTRDRFERLRFDVKFHDAKGQLVDRSSSSYLDVELEPGGEAPFRLAVRASTDPASYARCEVRVASGGLVLPARPDRPILEFDRAPGGGR